MISPEPLQAAALLKMLLKMLLKNLLTDLPKGALTTRINGCSAY